MRAVQVPAPGEGFETVERARPEPADRAVRVTVEACSVGQLDTSVLEGRPPIEYPRVPGHEIAGRIDAVGPGVETWSVGDRVAVNAHGGHCFTCEPCRRGDFVNCENGHTTGLLGDGGFAEQVSVAREALVDVPDALSAVEAAALVCSGTTAFTALRGSDVGPGDRVAVVGVGGVGHLGVQYADAMGVETVAVSRTPEKRRPAREMGADAFVDATEDDPGEALAAMGGADRVLVTAPSSDAVESAVSGLAPNGEVVVVGVPEQPVAVTVTDLFGRQSITGWSAGEGVDAEDALRTAAREGVSPRVERFPLDEAGTAVDRMVDGDLRFKAVLEP